MKSKSRPRSKGVGSGFDKIKIKIKQAISPYHLYQTITSIPPFYNSTFVCDFFFFFPVLSWMVDGGWWSGSRGGWDGMGRDGIGR